MSCNEIVTGLWVGDAKCALSPPFIKQNNISLIINCTKEIPAPFRHVKYMRIPVKDPGPFKNIDQKDVNLMTQFLPHVVDIIYQEILNGGNVLIHCRAGVQRSAAVATAFLLKYYRKNKGDHLTLQEAISLVLKNRPVAFYRGYYVNFHPALNYFNKFHLGRS